MKHITEARAQQVIQRHAQVANQSSSSSRQMPSQQHRVTTSNSSYKKTAAWTNWAFSHPVYMFDSTHCPSHLLPTHNHILFLHFIIIFLYSNRILLFQFYVKVCNSHYYNFFLIHQWLAVGKCTMCLNSLPPPPPFPFLFCFLSLPPFLALYRSYPLKWFVATVWCELDLSVYLLHVWVDVAKLNVRQC